MSFARACAREGCDLFPPPCPAFRNIPQASPNTGLTPRLSPKRSTARYSIGSITPKQRIVTARQVRWWRNRCVNHIGVIFRMRFIHDNYAVWLSDYWQPFRHPPSVDPSQHAIQASRVVFASVGILFGGVTCDSGQLADEVIINLDQCVPTASVSHKPLAFRHLNRNRNDPSVYQVIPSASRDTTTGSGLLSGLLTQCQSFE